MAFADFHPDQAVTWRELLHTLYAIKGADAASTPEGLYAELSKNSPLQTVSLDLKAPVRRKEAGVMLTAFFTQRAP